MCVQKPRRVLGFGRQRFQRVRLDKTLPHKRQLDVERIVQLDEDENVICTY